MTLEPIKQNSGVNGSLLKGGVQPGRQASDGLHWRPRANRPRGLGRVLFRVVGTACQWTAVEVVIAGTAVAVTALPIDTPNLDTRAAGFAAVVYGHSHQLEINDEDNVL